jgi:hypothetical protein
MTHPDTPDEAVKESQEPSVQESPEGSEEGSPKESVFGRMKGKALEMKSSVKDKIADISEAGMDKLREMLAEVNDILPFLRELGYSVDGLQVGIGLIPTVAIDIGGLTKTMAPETYARILEEQKERALLVAIIKTLQTTSAVQQKIKLIQMQSDDATITLGIPPKVTLKFKKDA